MKYCQPSNKNIPQILQCYCDARLRLANRYLPRQDHLGSTQFFLLLCVQWYALLSSLLSQLHLPLPYPDRSWFTHHISWKLSVIFFIISILIKLLLNVLFKLTIAKTPWQPFNLLLIIHGYYKPGSWPFELTWNRQIQQKIGHSTDFFVLNYIQCNSVRQQQRSRPQP